jgi:hypothetical protein
VSCLGCRWSKIDLKILEGLSMGLISCWYWIFLVDEKSD